jgi:cysteine desulfurase
VLLPVRSRGGRTVAVDAEGRVDTAALAAAIDESVGFVSVMAANNEVGTVQPLAEIVRIVRDRAPEAVVHSDAVQALTWLPLHELSAGLDLITVSAHKFGGPPGVGALVVRSGTPLAAQVVGGGQERERRSGTQNVPGAVAMAAAATAAARDRPRAVVEVARLRGRLVDGLLGAVDGCVETGGAADDRAERVAGAAHLCISGIESEALLFLLEQEGVSASAASSCASGAMQTSHVLAAMGVAPEQARGSLRLSLGWTTTDAEIDHALAVIPAAVEQLRAGAPVLS